MITIVCSICKKELDEIYAEDGTTCSVPVLIYNPEDPSSGNGKLKPVVCEECYTKMKKEKEEYELKANDYLKDYSDIRKELMIERDQKRKWEERAKNAEKRYSSLSEIGKDRHDHCNGCDLEHEECYCWDVIAALKKHLKDKTSKLKRIHEWLIENGMTGNAKEVEKWLNEIKKEGDDTEQDK